MELHDRFPALLERLRRARQHEWVARVPSGSLHHALTEPPQIFSPTTSAPSRRALR